MSIPRLTSTLLLALALTACSLDTTTTTSPPVDPTADSFASSLGVDLTSMTKLADGLYVKDTQVGTGREVARGDSVQVFYTGYLNSGYTFDTNIGGTALGFRQGAGRIIAGFDEGLLGMKVGGKRRLVIPSQLAYGQYGAYDVYGRLIIPPNANLVFDIQLVAAQP